MTDTKIETLLNDTVYYEFSLTNVAVRIFNVYFKQYILIIY